MRLAVLVGLVACGDNLSVREPDSPQSGSRLQLIHHVYDDGTRQLDSDWLHDAARAENCAPEVWSDGQRYCTPASLPAVFTDETCSTLAGSVITHDPPIVPVYFRREFALRGDRLTSRLYEPRERIAVPEAVWELQDNVCLGPFPADPFHDYYAVGPEIAATAFARVGMHDVDGGRLVASVYTSADGMQLPFATARHDTLLDTPCTLEAQVGDETAACAPPTAAARYFRDVACSEAAVAVAASSERPDFAAFADVAGCPAYARTGEELFPPPLYQVTATGCTEALVTSGDRVFALGAMLDVATVVRERVIEPERRLARIELVDGDLRTDDPRLWDAELATECERTDTSAGERCLPVSRLAAVREPIFRDAACTAPLVLVLVPAQTCVPPAYLVAGEEVRSLAAHIGPIYHLSTSDLCLPFEVSGSDRPFAASDPIPLARFAGATASP